MTNPTMETTGKLLKIVGNETRRQILSLLSKEPHYILQLSRKLTITQPAIIKHLSILEKAGLIENFERKSNRGAARKYYKICDNINLEIVIGPKAFKVTRRTPTKKCPKYFSKKKNIEQLTHEINCSKDVNAKAEKAPELIKEADALLSCEEYSKDDQECSECHRIASLKKKTAQIILHVSQGDTMKGLHLLSEILSQFR